jgi:hypothetical protein
MFIIEDEIHAELCGKFSSFSEAIAELQARSQIPWDEKPNVCPCTSWKTCEREYSIVEYDTSVKPWREISRTPVLNISAKGTIWNKDSGVHQQEQGAHNQEDTPGQNTAR